MMDNLNEKKIEILSGEDIKIVLIIKIYSSYIIESEQYQIIYFRFKEIPLFVQKLF